MARLLHATVYYTGEYLWGRKEQVTQQVPSIISKDLWEKAQEALQLNRKDNPGNAKRDYLLRSLIKCGFCNRSMVGMAFGGQDRRAYRCIAKLKASLAPHCPSRYIPLEKIESLVWNQLSDWILRREDIERVLAESLREYEAQQQEWAMVLAQARTDLEMKDRERDRILTLYGKGLIGDADIEQQLREIEREKDVLTRTAA